MSDLFKRDAPRMTDDEDRRVWERVRQAARPMPWWAAAWQRPAVRFGLPAVAVVLVALVWVAVEQPASTHAPAPHAVALDRARPVPMANAPVAPAPTPVPPAVPEKKAAPRRAMRDFAVAPTPSAVGGAAAPGAPAGQPAPAKAQLLKEEPVATQNEVAPAPAPAAGAPSEAAPQALAPAKPSTSTWGKTKSQYRGDSNGSLAPTQRSLTVVRGGRADELSAEVAAPGSALATVAAALVNRPLAFTAPLPLSLAGESGAMQAAGIDVAADGTARGRLVPLGAPDQVIARYADATVAERLLLVAFAADQLGPNAPVDRLAALRAEATRLATAGPEPAAAQLLLDQLSRLQK